MKHFIVTFLIASLLFTSAFSAQLKAEQITYLKNLKGSGSKFGQNLFNAIQLVLSADGGEAIDKIQQILQEMEDDLTNAQNDREAQYATDSAQCDSDLSQLNADLSQAQEDLTNYQNEESSLQNDIDNQNGFIGTTQLLISSLQSYLDSLNSIREAQHAEYQSTFDEYSNDIAVLNQGKQIIQQLQAGSSFIEKKYELKQKPAMVELSNQFKNLQTSKGKGVHAFANFFMTLLQQPGIQADQEIVTLILQTIDDLIAQLAQTLNTYTLTENQRQSDFESQSADTQNQINEQNNLLDAAQSSVTNDQLQLTFVQGQISDLNDTITVKTDQLQIRTADCANIDTTFQDATQNYNDELDIIHQVQAIFVGIEANQGQMDVIKNLNVDTTA